jgi:glucosamine kinase
MSKHLFIGIDGGATFCRARIRDIGGNLLGEGRGGPANIHADLPLAVQSIRAASESAGRAAGLDRRSLQRAYAGLGLAGAGIQSACDGLMRRMLRWWFFDVIRPSATNVSMWRLVGS